MNFNWVLEMTSFSKMVKGSKKYHLSVSGIPDLAIQAKHLRDDNGSTTECSAFFPIEKRSECSCLEGGGRRTMKWATSYLGLLLLTKEDQREMTS